MDRVVLAVSPFSGLDSGKFCCVVGLKEHEIVLYELCHYYSEGICRSQLGENEESSDGMKNKSIMSHWQSSW